MNTPTVLIAACNPRIMLYCLLHRAPSSVPYRRPNQSSALGILLIKCYYFFSLHCIF